MITSDTRAPSTPGALERFLDRHLAEFVRRQAAERAVEGPDRRPRGANDDNVVLHENLLDPWLARGDPPASCAIL